MKRVLFVINNLKTGGVQSSLLNLVKEIQNRYEITILCFDRNRENLEKVPSNVKIITAISLFRFLGVSQRELKKNPFAYTMRAFYAVLAKMFGRSFVLRLMFIFQKKIGDFDYAVSFLHEGAQNKLYGGCNEFVLKKIVANKKITWLHGDFARCGANCKKNIEIYEQFDEIVACSEGTKLSLVKCFPEFKQKCFVIRNCNNFNRIRQLAKNGIEYPANKFNIVTVSRLGEEKGIDRAIIAISKCIKKGYVIHYYVVGDGNMKDKLQDLCKECGIADAVSFYGNQLNPYRFIKNADLFLLPSYHEAAPMVFDESACLGVPILATKTTSTSEMIESIGSGFVCENSQEGIENALLDIVEHTRCLSVIRNKMKGLTFTNDQILASIEKNVFN